LISLSLYGLFPVLFRTDYPLSSLSYSFTETHRRA